MTQCTERTPTTTQRQSCDRCYKQKLRCIRGKEENSGVCDRCLSKRLQCVYSYSLPKGRPSQHRLAERSKASNVSGTSPKDLPLSSEGEKVTRPITGSDANTGSTVEVDATSVMFPTSCEPSTAPSLGDLSALSWDGALPWTDHQFGIDWTPHHPKVAADGDTLVASLDAESLVMDMDLQIGFQCDAEKSDIMPSEQKNYAGLIITKLSQLSMNLSAIRSVTLDLTKAAESSSTHQVLLDSPASFNLVTAWLSSMDSVTNMTLLADKPSSFLNPHMETIQAEGRDSLLRDVFSSSLRLLEIIQHIKLNTITEAESKCQQDIHTAPVIRHLVMACNALLLEIFTVVVTRLEHDTSTEKPMSRTTTMVVGDLRLVLVAKICTYLTERQRAATDQFLGQVEDKDFDTTALQGQRAQMQQKLASLQQRLFDF